MSARTPTEPAGQNVPDGFYDSNPNYAAVPVPDRWPAHMRELFEAARAAGWETTVYHGRDYEGHQFLTVYANEPVGPRGYRSLVACWHTRGGPGGLPPSPYRLFGCTLYGPGDEWRNVTLLWAVAVLRTTRHEDEADRG